MNITKVNAFSKTQAIEKLENGINPKFFTNATQSWQKSGCPTTDRELNAFLEDYMNKHNKPYVYISLTPSSPDTRMRPYSVVSVPTEGARKYRMTYQVKPAELSVQNGELKVLSTGGVAAIADKKIEAQKLMKDLITKNKRDYIIEIVKEVVEGTNYAAYGKYVPSKTAVEGTFIFAVAE